jgi:hypothetical protein
MEPEHDQFSPSESPHVHVLFTERRGRLFRGVGFLFTAAPFDSPFWLQPMTSPGRSVLFNQFAYPHQLKQSPDPVSGGAFRPSPSNTVLGFRTGGLERLSANPSSGDDFQRFCPLGLALESRSGRPCGDRRGIGPQIVSGSLVSGFTDGFAQNQYGFLV